jgi:hypothetical protein
VTSPILTSSGCSRTYATARATASGDIANFCPAFCNSSLSFGLFKRSLNAVSVKPGRIVLHAALLQPFGISVAVFDTMLNDPAEGFRSKLEQHRPTIVVVYEDNFNFLSKMCLTRMREVAYDILDASRKAGTVAIVNGSDVSDQALDYPQRGFRCVPKGESEWTLVEVSAELAEQRECSILAISRDWRRLETNARKCFMPGVALSCATWMPCHFQLENWWTLISIKTRGNPPTAIFQRILLPAAGARTGVTGAPKAIEHQYRCPYA